MLVRASAFRWLGLVSLSFIISWSLLWGWGSYFQGCSHTWMTRWFWLLVGAPVSLHMGLSMGCLSILITWQLASSKRGKSQHLVSEILVSEVIICHFYHFLFIGGTLLNLAHIQGEKNSFLHFKGRNIKKSVVIVENQHIWEVRYAWLASSAFRLIQWHL